MKQLIAKQPWLPFLVLGLVAQQANMLTYKFGGEVALPCVFLAYSFFVQAIINMMLVWIFKSRGFPVVLGGRMRLWVLWVAFVYICNEMTFMTVYRSGAPYGLMMTVFACCGILIMTAVGILFIKEKISSQQVVGIVLAAISIAMVKLG